MLNMLIVGIICFVAGVTGLEMREMLSNFFSISPVISFLGFGAMLLYGSALLLLGGFFYPLRIKA